MRLGNKQLKMEENFALQKSTEYLFIEMDKKEKYRKYYIYYDEEYHLMDIYNDKLIYKFPYPIDSESITISIKVCTDRDNYLYNTNNVTMQIIESKENKELANNLEQKLTKIKRQIQEAFDNYGEEMDSEIAFIKSHLNETIKSEIKRQVEEAINPLKRAEDNRRTDVLTNAKCIDHQNQINDMMINYVQTCMFMEEKKKLSDRINEIEKNLKENYFTNYDYYRLDSRLIENNENIKDRIESSKKDIDTLKQELTTNIRTEINIDLLKEDLKTLFDENNNLRKEIIDLKNMYDLLYEEIIKINRENRPINQSKIPDILGRINY